MGGRQRLQEDEHALLCIQGSGRFGLCWLETWEEGKEWSPQSRVSGRVDKGMAPCLSLGSLLCLSLDWL